jgi:hypothetical protein
MEFNPDKFRAFLKSSLQMSDLVVESDRWKALQYETEQAILIDAMPFRQLLSVHQLLTHGDTAKKPVVFVEIQASTTFAILREENGMRVFVSREGNYVENFYQ